MPDGVRINPDNHHMVFACRCGEAISLPAYAQAYQVCACGRRWTFDTDTIRSSRPVEQREAVSDEAAAPDQSTVTRLIPPERMPRPDIRHWLFRGVSVASDAQNAWLDALAQVESVTPFSRTLGDMALDCKRQGHTLRVSGCRYPLFSLEHVGSDGHVYREPFPLPADDLLLGIALWLEDCHADRESPDDG